ncbi:hypothetical protein BLS_009335 [Venturia inaequalis]|uniref:Uncharacterized protein n=1 Tax=Venturia inaequalis TaxID=5025 RepID=A0A8H3UQE9_VENIN|nr:hypothetical protein BLS_009335 [Venturia inaequalis]KAE9973738.1 hypothetical protein EG327_008994 [Venturia inaequalis]
MKSLSLFTTALAVGSTLAIPHDLGHPEFLKLGKRQSNIGAMVNNAVNPKGGRVPAPAGAAPAKVELDVRIKVAGAKTTKMRYGPYKVPSMKVVNILGEEGSLWNYADTVAPKPCEECTIVGMNAGLEYPDGTNANIDTGMWLHHMVLFTIGPGRKDATCGDAPFSMPHLIVGSNAKNSERLFSSGNERTHAIMPEWKMDNVGYKLKSADKFALIVDLMNENPVDKIVYLTMTFDTIPGNPPEYDDMKPVWFDVAQCLTSEWPPPYNTGNYTVPSMIWTANFDGDIIGAAGHLHDGGQQIILDVDGQQACNSEASYGGSPEYIAKTAMHPGSATEHISKMSLCVGDSMTVKKLQKGQKWKLRAEYDYNKNKGMIHEKGKQSTVMGISIMFVRIPKTAA